MIYNTYNTEMHKVSCHDIVALWIPLLRSAVRLQVRYWSKLSMVQNKTASTCFENSFMNKSPKISS